MKRKKQKRLLLILLLILAVLAVGYVILLRYNAAKEAETEETESTIALWPKDFDSSSIASISYLNGDSSLTFNRKTDEDTDTWIYAADNDFPLNQSALSGMNSQLQSLTASRSVTDSLDNLTEYGLDQPVNTITATDQNGTSVTLYLGSTNSGSDITYAYTSQSDHVYTIASDFADYFNRPLLKLIEADTLPLPSGAAEYKSISIAGKNSSLNMNYNPDGNDQVDYLGKCSWIGEEDGDTYPISDANASVITEAILGLEITDCAAYKASPEELKAFGLDQPQAVVTVQSEEEETIEEESSTDSSETTVSEEESGTDEESDPQKVKVPHTLTLRIGSCVDDYYYVSWNSIDQVYRMAASLITPFLDAAKENLICMEPFNFDLTTIDSLTVSYGDAKWDMVINRPDDTSESDTANDAESSSDSSSESDDKTGSSVDITVTVNGKEVSYSDFSSMMAHLQQIQAEKIWNASENTAGTGTDSMKIHVDLNRKNRSSVYLELYSYNSSYYAVSVDGTPTWLINKNDIASIRSALNDFAEQE
ncbi:MAG: DUF4340 domain-containing protein [Lachnospiraceae bacterium]|nr:DUF4340 domain-containing protein [Lachnospiraceae bacterium]